MVKRKIPILEDLSPQSKELFDVLSKESDLACVLIGTSYLDQCLASMLKRFFIEGNAVYKIPDPLRHGALSTFSSRIDLIYLLGLINEYIYNDLIIIKNIRNLFAHSHFRVYFKDDKIKKKCEELELVDKLDKKFKGILNKRIGRDRFSQAVVLISQILIVSGLSLKHRSKNIDFVKHLHKKDNNE